MTVEGKNKQRSIIIVMLILTIFIDFGTNKIMANTEANYRMKTVVIDAGHGGKDPGCLGSSSREKHIALNIALKLGAYIKESFPDIKVIYTRDTDVFIELHERANIANRNNADIFISVHCNASAASSVYGTETYVMGLHKSTSNLDVAKRENAVILKEDNYTKHYDGFDPNSTEAHILFSLYQNAFMDQSISLASLIQDQFKSRVSRKDRGVRQAGFLVLYKTTMPSVLIETGFLTNRTEETWMKNEKNQDYLSSAIFRAFRDYKNAMEGTSETEKIITTQKETIKEPSKIEASTETAALVKVQTTSEKTTVKKDVEIKKPEIKEEKKNETTEEKTESPVAKKPTNSTKTTMNSSGHVISESQSNSIPKSTKEKQTTNNTTTYTDPVKVKLNTKQPLPIPAAEKPSVKKEDIPKTKLEAEVIFRVQLDITKVPANTTMAKYKSFEKIYHEKTSWNAYKNLIGNIHALQPAISMQNKARAAGFKDAFIVTYHDTKRISMTEALAIIKESKNK